MRGLLLVGAVTVGMAVLAGGKTPPAGQSRDISLSVAGQTYQLVSGDTACTIHRIVDDMTGLSRVALDPVCGSALPILASVDGWRDNADGSISLTGAEGRSLIEFAPADGEGYESFGQGAPIASLHQSN